MQKFLSFIKEFRIPKKEELTKALKSFSKKEFYVFSGFVLAALVSMLVVLNDLNNRFMVDVPVSGGSITEGIIGIPNKVNPVIATSNADKDLVALIYSGLMRRTSNGDFIPDLAESYEVSPDGLTYTFVIRKDARFHDGEKVKADDVVFTIEKIKNPAIKSPKKDAWDMVSVEKVDDNKVVFKLKQPYISFLDNTTVGILPMHIWKDVKDADFEVSPFNIKAVGSGPYKFKSVVKNKDDNPVEYALKSFGGFVLGVPHIKQITMISYSNEKELVQALTDGTVNQAGGISPKNASEIKQSSITINTAATPRIFGIFYNSTNNKIFADPNIVKAFDYAIDKKAVVDAVLYGYGTEANSPIPETILDNDSSNTTVEDNIKRANDLLEKSGWKIGPDGIRIKGGVTTVNKTKKVGKKTVTVQEKVNNGPVTELSFSLITGDTPELRQATEIIKTQLATIGVRVNTDKVYETGPINQIIKNREYEALFFGQVINHESDLYSFWHSSQRSSGLNISMYNNPKADKILEDAQKITDTEKRDEKYDEFVDIFNKDLPAILIYSPKYLYVTNDKLNNINLDTLINPSDRFATVYEWYANKDHVWKIFTK